MSEQSEGQQDQQSEAAQGPGPADAQAKVADVGAVAIDDAINELAAPQRVLDAATLGLPDPASEAPAVSGNAGQDGAAHDSTTPAKESDTQAEAEGTHTPLLRAQLDGVRKIAVGDDGTVHISYDSRGADPLLSQLPPNTTIHVTDEGVHAIVSVKPAGDAETHPKFVAAQTHKIVADVEQGLEAFVERIKRFVATAEGKAREII